MEKEISKAALKFFDAIMECISVAQENGASDKEIVAMLEDAIDLQQQEGN